MGVRLNGTDLSDLGIGMTDISGWADIPQESRDSFQTGGSFGQIDAGVEELDARVISIEGLVKGNTLTTRQAVVDAALAQMRGRCEITPDDQPDRVIVGRLLRHSTRGITGVLTMLRDVIRVRFDFTCYDPNYRDMNAQVIGFDSTARPVPMGSAAHKWEMTLAGGTDPVIVTVRDFRGTEVASMEMDGTLAADEYWRLDGYRQRVWLVDSGVETADDDELVDGAFFVFDPLWADPVTGTNPTIEVDSGSGILTYWRRWKT